MKKTLKKGAFSPFALMLIVCMTFTAVLAGCSHSSSPESDEKSITSFKIGDAAGAIRQDTISVIVPTDTDVSSLEPEITVSGGATVSPASGEAVDFTNPTTYVVIAKDGSARTYVVTVGKQVTLSSISVLSAPVKTNYIKGEDLDITGLVVRGYYTDGLYQIENVTMANISNYDKNRLGSQSVLITLNDRQVTFSVTVRETLLSSISIMKTPVKTTYVKGEELDLEGLVVRGYYVDGSYEIEDVTMANISFYDKDRAGNQNVYVTINGISTNFSVTVNNTEPLELTIGVAEGGNDEIEIYGIPAGGIVLSREGRNNLPDWIVISVGGTTSAVYSNITWYIDGTQVSTGNIYTINAASYTYTQPHDITIVATKNNATYSKTISFTVEL